MAARRDRDGYRERGGRPGAEAPRRADAEARGHRGAARPSPPPTSGARSSDPPVTMGPQAAPNPGPASRPCASPPPCSPPLRSPPPRPSSRQPRKPPAKLDPRFADAKRYFDDGAEAYRQGNYDAAIKAWEKSYELSQKPLILENIANAWERLGDARKARDNLAKWREAAPPEERDLLDARIRNLSARVAREEEAAAQAAAAQAAREAQLRAAAEQAQAPSPRPWLPGAIVGGVGVAAIIAGVAVDVAASKDRPGAGVCKSVGGQNLCMSSAESAITQSNRMAIAGDVTWIIGAAAVAAGAVLVIVRRPAPQPKDSAPPAAAPAPAAYLAPALGGVVLGGSF